MARGRKKGATDHFWLWRCSTTEKPAALAVDMYQAITQSFKENA